MILVACLFPSDKDGPHTVYVARPIIVDIFIILLGVIDIYNMLTIVFNKVVFNYEASFTIVAIYFHYLFVKFTLFSCRLYEGDYIYFNM